MTRQAQTPILVVSGVDPRAQQNGVVMRVGQAVDALSELGPVDVAVIRPDLSVGGEDEIPTQSAASRVRLFA